ncbi:MAG: 23S rRNA (guanosine(2251)-2'-O)-methyltransferase RlmB [Bacilli bacterium]|nr:23S rRNA (guanosine(2251)-2'-O)-methyltransferase RlmB [Bacilli bacterium]
MLIYGKNVAKEALKEKNKIKKIFLVNNFNDTEVINLLNENDFNIIYKDRREMDHMVSGLHQGIALEVEDFRYTEFTKIIEDEVIVILDHLEDPHNLGAIIRTCEAAGIKSIIIPKDRSVGVNATVIKTSVGTIENVKICEVTNLVNSIKELKKNNFWIVGTDMDGTDYRKIDYSGKVAIVIGNEGKGISRLVKEECDFVASIPMNGTVNSLNASVAAGIIIFEAIRGKSEL